MCLILLAGLGINGAKVNFEIDNDVTELGGLVRGRVYVSGGEIDQVISEILISLEVTSRFQVGEEARHMHQEIARGIVARQLMLKANSPEITFPVQFELSYNIPISTP